MLGLHEAVWLRLEYKRNRRKEEDEEEAETMVGREAVLAAAEAAGGGADFTSSRAYVFWNQHKL